MGKGKNGIPMTRQIAQELEKQIGDGTLAEGARLPSVRELAARYAVSTAVCLSAYRALEAKQLVVRRPGSGTFVHGEAHGESKNCFFNWGCVLPPLETAALAEKVVPELELRHFPAAEYSYNAHYLEWIGQQKQPGLAALNEGQIPVLASRGRLLPLDSLLGSSIRLVRERFPKAVLRSMSWNGKLYALPLTFSPMMLFYNRRIFRRSGIPEPAGDWGWEELLRHVKLLTVESEGRISCYALAMLFTLNSYAPFIFQNGGELFDSNGNCAIDSDETFEALSFFSELFRLPGVCSHRHGDPRSALADLMSNDLAAMLIGDGVDCSMLQERMPEEDWGVVRLPGRYNHKTSLSVWGVGITGNGPDSAALFELLERLFDAEVYGGYCRNICGMPAYGPMESGVPHELFEALREAHPSLQCTSPRAPGALSETLNLVLSHKMALSRTHCREFEEKINAKL